MGKLTGKTAITSVDSLDVLHVVDVSDTSSDPAGTSKKVTYSNFISAPLNSIKGLTTAADKMIYTTALDTYAVADLTSAGRAILDDANASAQRTTLGVAIGSDVQAYDLVLDEISSQTIASESGTSRTLALTDANDYIRTTNASAVTITVPPNSSVAFPVGTRVEVFQHGAGQVTFAEGSGVTINKAEGLKISAQYKAAALVKVATNEWDLIGSLAA